MDKVKIGSNIYESKLPNGTILFWSYNTVLAGYLTRGEQVGYVRTEEHYSKTTTRQLNKWLSGLEYRTVSQRYLDSFKN